MELYIKKSFCAIIIVYFKDSQKDPFSMSEQPKPAALDERGELAGKWKSLRVQELLCLELIPPVKNQEIL